MAQAQPEIHLSPASKKRTREELSPTEISDEQNDPVSSDDNLDRKKRKLIGPSFPPPEVEGTHAPQFQSDDESDLDDDFGPALPPDNVSPSLHRRDSIGIEAMSEQPKADSLSRSQRDAWMLAPPTPSDWTSRIDSTKLRNRKFTSGKATPANPTGGSSGDVWTETLQQKKSRLQNEVMGLSETPGITGGSMSKYQSKTETDAIDLKIRRYNDINRGASLVSEHTKVKSLEKDDDPSNRAFDREKDIAGSSNISHTQRKELLNKAADFGSRFAKGSYL